MLNDKLKKLARCHTQRAAESAVQAELNRRRISSAPTLANERSIDLVAIHHNGRLLPIEVKGLQNRNSEWLVKRPIRKDIIYFFVFVPTNDLHTSVAFEFFIMTANEVHEAMEKYLNDRRTRGTPDKAFIKSPAVRWKDAQPHKNAWGKLDKSGNS